MLPPSYLDAMPDAFVQLAQQVEGLSLHITSLNPIRPENRPDPWEAEALERFDRGEKEVLALILEGAEPMHRYMAPLYVTQPCLQCHAEQGYKLGDNYEGITNTEPHQYFRERHLHNKPKCCDCWASYLSSDG